MSLEVEGLGLGSRSRKRVEVYGSSVEVRVRGLRFDFYAAMSYGRLGLQASPLNEILLLYYICYFSQ